MSEVATLIEDMIRAGVDPALVGRAAALLAGRAPARDEQAERRRTKDRERKRLRNSAESADSAESPLPSPDGPLSLPHTPTHTPLNPPSSPAAPAAAEPAAPRQAQPEAGQGRMDYDEIHNWLAGLVGQNPVALNFDTSPIVSLLRAGFSRERIEIGVRAAVAGAKQPIRSWKSFDGWVKNTTAEAAPIAKPIDRETEWRNKLKRWHEKGDWPGVWGDPPGHPCCSIPAAFIAAHRPNPLEIMDRQSGRAVA